MRVQILHLNGPFRGKTQVYPEERVTIGKAPDAVLRYPEAVPVEDHHAEIRYFEEACSFHLKAVEGRVFVNNTEVREIILQHNDLIELGVGGPKIRFRVWAEKGATCKPVRQMIEDASEVRKHSGIFPATRVLGNDLFRHATLRLKIGFPLAIILVAVLTSWVTGHFTGKSTLRERERKEIESARIRERAEKQRADRFEAQVNEMRELFQQIVGRQDQLVGKDELAKVRAEIDRQAAVVDDVVGRDGVLRSILDKYSASVCLIHGVYGLFFDDDGVSRPLSNPDTGEPLTIEYTGSGFLASERGEIVTNRHVAEPWWENSEVESMLGSGLTPQFIRLDVCFPDREPIAVDPSTIRISQEGVDVAVMRAEVKDVPVTPLEKGDVADFRGAHVILLGYPTGIRALLARSEREDVDRILDHPKDMTEIIAELSRSRAISPIITQGALNEVKSKRLVYDAETTSGGSGGPVFSMRGTVIGVNFAITRDFDGSNFGVPIQYALHLLEAETPEPQK